MSTVTGLIDGMGSAGSAVGQLFVPIIQNNFGWVYVFYLFIIMNIGAALCLVRRFVHDVQILMSSYQPINTHNIESEPLLIPRPDSP